LSSKSNALPSISRRDFIRTCAATATLTSVPILGGWDANGQPSSGKRGPATRTFSLDQNWLFGGKFHAAAANPGFDDISSAQVTLPHCVTPLSWQKWDPTTWEDVWIYRRHFARPDGFVGNRAFLHFDRVMTAATPTFNGHTLEKHLGGYLPFRREVTSLIKESNVLSVEVDSRWMSVPPAGSPKGVSSVDYLLPGGINGSVNLHIVPQVFISDVFAKPVDVLDANRHLEITCTIDAGAIFPGQFHLTASLWSHSKMVARTTKSLGIEKTGESNAVLTLTDLRDIMLWDVSAPHLYDLVVTLSHNNEPLHDYRTRVGFREACFKLDGFYLNGKRLQLFGLDRHELYPYVGYAMPNRVLRRDAEILRHDFNCNIVRCSHYPQSEAFLDACDELGLMVWEETPGWQYIGDERWQDLTVSDVKEMVRRDRNRPSVVIWGVRINESRNDPAFYQRTREAAKALDDSRPTSGTMTPSSLKNWRTEWHQDVFAFDDYHRASDGGVGIMEPLPGVPYMIAESVGQFN
jgi:beta-galactosidase